tara:strand:- start:51 stop:944 length:894 start_codon:yes stop_codon:yes gene_type:complete
MALERIGFIGLGNMGNPMAGNLVKAGYSVICYDIAGTEERAPEGAEIASSATQIAGNADIVFTSVDKQKSVESIAEEIAAANDRTVSVFIDTSTIGSNTARAAEARLKEVDVTYIDSPVAGGSGSTGVGHEAAKAASLTFIVAGPSAAVERVRPAMEVMGRKVFHVGEEPGQAQAIKLINNFVFTASLISVSEAMVYGLNQNLDMKSILEVLNVSSGQNVATSYIFPTLVETETYDVGATIEILAKDVSVYADEVRSGNSPNAVGTLVSKICAHMEREMPGADWSRMYPFVRDGGEG